MPVCAKCRVAYMDGESHVCAADHPQTRPIPVDRATWGEALLLGGLVGLLFRVGLILQASGRTWGVMLSGIAFIIGMISVWGMRPFYKPFVGVLLGYGVADLVMKWLF